MQWTVIGLFLLVFGLMVGILSQIIKGQMKKYDEENDFSALIRQFLNFFQWLALLSLLIGILFTLID